MNIGVGIGINYQQNLTRTDADAQAFITAAGITDATQKAAINTLVKGLKTASLWTKMKAIYPMVGGTATAHKFNLKDPRDLDDAFRLSFSGGWTHSATGALPNGTNTYADTFFTPNLLGQNSAHLSYYSRSNTNQGGAVEIGSANAGQASSFVIIAARSLTISYYVVNEGVFGCTSTDNDARGFWLASRIASNNEKGYRNGSQRATATTASVAPNANKIVIGAYNNNDTIGQYSNKECALSSIGDGLDATEQANFYTAVNTFQTTLGRNV